MKAISNFRLGYSAYITVIYEPTLKFEVDYCQINYCPHKR